jgi:hypothetical protein
MWLAWWEKIVTGFAAKTRRKETLGKPRRKQVIILQWIFKN